MTDVQLVFLFVAAIGAGAVNALAGGGSILTFPALLAAGLPPVAANITNSVALCPGYVGGVFAQRHDLRGQARRLVALLPVSAVGGLFGGLLILRGDEGAFEAVVPWLLVGACALLAVQGRVRAWLQARTRGSQGLGWAMVPVLPAAIYGGYFGAGLSVIFLAVLGLTLHDTLTRLNALKQALSLAANVAAGMLFMFAPELDRPAALTMAGGALIGGALGGRLASKVRPERLRGLVIAVGLAVAILLFVKG